MKETGEIKSSEPNDNNAMIGIIWAAVVIGLFLLSITLVYIYK